MSAVAKGHRPARYPYELFLQLEEIEHRTLLDEHFRIMGRTKFYEGVEEMQADLDAYLVTYNPKRPHEGRNMNGRTPATVFVAGLPKTEKSRLNYPSPGAASVR